MSHARTANLLGALALGLTDVIRAVGEEETALGGEGAAALVVVGQEPGASIRSLSAALQLTHPGTVRVVDRLVRAGLVLRRPVPHGADRRAVALHLTARGQRKVNALLTARQARLGDALAALSPAEQRALTPLLEKLLDHLTTSPARGDAICRMCNLAVCPKARCPVDKRLKSDG